MKIDANVKQIKSLKDYFFIVPDYQREYVWEVEKNVSRFLQDINDEFNPNIDEQSNYFIGSLIVVEDKDGLYNVIDGQQRLTTIIITLCAMRETLAQVNNEDLAEERNELLKIIQDLLYEYSIGKKKKTPRLELQYEESKDFILKLIENKDYEDIETNSIIRMKDAYNTILEFLVGLKESDPCVVIKFISYFLVNVEMVVIEPDNISSALKIFETINERGVSLNAMDLLKNLLFANAQDKDFKKIKEIWQKIIINLQDCNEGDKPLRFLRYFLIARYHNGILREDQIYSWITSSTGKTKIQYEKDQIKFAKEILSASEKYSAFIKATDTWDADLDYPHVTGIAYLSKSARIPFILLLALKDSFEKKEINLLAKNLEVLMFYYATNKVLTKYYESLFAELSVKIRSLNSLSDLQTFIKSELGPIIDKQKQAFEANFDNRNQAELLPQYRIKYILGKVEDYIRIKGNLPINNLSYYQDQHLEHILPQSGENIPTDLYPQTWDYNNAVYKIGNLTLLEGPINQSLNYSNDISSNNWFNVKTDAYKNSSIYLTKTFTENKIGQNTAFNKFVSENLKHYQNWNKETIISRQHVLKELMLKVWSVDTN